MTDQWDLLKETLDGDIERRDLLTGPHRRLVDAWFSELPGTTIAGDIAALLGHVLRHRRGTSGIAKSWISLPLEERGVPVETLRRANLVATKFGLDAHLVSLANNWVPQWLQGDVRWIDLACTSPDDFKLPDGAVSTSARHEMEVPADPAVSAIAGIKTYRSHSQASAIRTAALAPAGSTLHVVLPTGTGKSLVGIAPGLLRRSGVTVVVVPTIALALDQERQIHKRFPNQGLPSELAYYGDRKEDEKETIRDRLRKGEQKVLFTSPEAFVTGLAQTLRLLAAKGELSHIVLDEAHLVRMWGLSFRPEFQVLASLIAKLREAALLQGVNPPLVELLTATLSRQSLLLNEELFAGPGPSLFVGSSHLRTELRYLFAPPVDNEVRIDRVIEALFRLPRPAIVYTTRKESAELIANRLRDAGFGRTAVFHGDTKPSDRAAILRDWSGDDRPTSVDVIVGTSAFGLGVDQSDVRTVIHACVPASVDRFYQEVGRGGRDGHAAVSVWIPSTTDIHEGRQIENSTVLTHQKSWGRWDAMRSTAVSADPSRRELVLNTEVVPQWLDFSSESNQLWNRNTLVLLQRAGVLDIVDTPPPTLERLVGEADAEWYKRVEDAWAAYVKHASVRIRPEIANLDQGTVFRAVDVVRKEIRESEYASQFRIERMFRLEECWGTILREEYAYEDLGPMHASLTVAPACSGCPAKGHKHIPSYRAAQPIVAKASIPQLRLPVSRTLAAMAGNSLTLVVPYREGELRIRLVELITKLVTHGIRGILASESLCKLPAVVEAGRHAPEGLVAIDRISAGPPRSFPIPTLILLDSTDPPRLSWIAGETGSLRIVVLPEDTPDPQYSDQTVKSIRVPFAMLSDFLRGM